jgi:hypothetical protein
VKPYAAHYEEQRYLKSIDSLLQWVLTLRTMPKHNQNDADSFGNIQILFSIA